MHNYSCIYFDINETANYKDKQNKIKNNKNKRSLKTKIIEFDNFIKNEIYISNEIKKIINYNKYFYIIDSHEVLNYMDMNNFNSKFDNTFDLDEIDYEYNHKPNLKYKKIDSNKILIKYIFIPNNTNFNDYLFSNVNSIFISNKRFLFHEIINIYKKLLKSINILNENYLFYNNLNSSSIIINLDNSLPLLSDFKFSISMKNNFENSVDIDNNENILNLILNLKNMIFHYDPSYFYWPIELHLISFIFQNNLLSVSYSNILQIIEDLTNENNNPILKNFSNNIKQKYYDDGLNYLKQFVNKSINYIIKNIFLYFKTWDNYSLSIMYLEIIINIHKLLNNKNNNFIVNFMKILLKNISFNPSLRFSIKLTRIEFNNLLNNVTYCEYDEILNVL